MATKIPLSIIEQITSDDINNDSSVSGSTLTNVLEQLKTDINNINDFDYSQAGDPATNTNPLNGIDSTWKNNTSGEIFVCIDASAGSNVWIGTADTVIGTAPTPSIGDNFGYVSGGWNSTNSNVIERFQLISSANAVDIGDLAVGVYPEGGSSSLTRGYNHGGTGSNNIIQKFAFSGSANAIDIGDLSSIIGYVTGHQSSSHGYTCGGDSPPGGTNTTSNVIEKYSHSTDGNATDVGDLVTALYAGIGQSSSDHGYVSGGATSDGFGSLITDIQRFPFASDTNATDVGDLNTAVAWSSGTQDSTHGYVASGRTSVDFNNTEIQRFLFSSSTSGADIGDLTIAQSISFGVSGSDVSYVCGGYNGSEQNAITSYTHAASTVTNDVGDLTTNRRGGAGHQN